MQYYFPFYKSDVGNYDSQGILKILLIYIVKFDTKFQSQKINISIHDVDGNSMFINSVEIEL